MTCPRAASSTQTTAKTAARTVREHHPAVMAPHPCIWASLVIWGYGITGDHTQSTACDPSHLITPELAGVSTGHLRMNKPSTDLGARIQTCATKGLHMQPFCSTFRRPPSRPAAAATPPWPPG